MSVARELVTRLSFAFDRTNLDKFEKAISNFKTKFDIARLAIESTFGRIIEKAKEFSNKILSNNALAKFSKTSVQDLTALQTAFQKFDFAPEKFNSFFENVSKQILESKFGVQNTFTELVRDSGGIVRRMVDGQLTTAKTAIEDFIIFIRTKTDESQRLRYIQNFFEVDLQTAESLNQLFKHTQDEFDKLIEKEKQSVEQLEKNKQAAQGFKTQINQLETEWDKFNTKVAAFAVPLLTQSLGGINLIAEQVQSEGVFSAFKFVGEAIVDGVKTAFGHGHLQNVQREVMADETDFWRRVQEQEMARINNQTTGITNNNKFEFNVPPGTKESEASYIKDQVVNTFNDIWDEKVREVINNNPLVE